MIEVIINGIKTLVDLSEPEHITEEMVEHWHILDMEDDLY